MLMGGILLPFFIMFFFFPILYDYSIGDNCEWGMNKL